ncbi:hypothetical protein [Aeromicrobium sp. UC242_57]|uniref:hypothetical protein n=1 Tax=Aeromicrobium sp. UC242_57 TaxID=3374624 RepID=UPI0037B6AA2E
MNRLTTRPLGAGIRRKAAIIALAAGLLRSACGVRRTLSRRRQRREGLDCLLHRAAHRQGRERG